MIPLASQCTLRGTTALRYSGRRLADIYENFKTHRHNAELISGLCGLQAVQAV